MHEDIEVDDEGVTISTQVRWLVNPSAIWESRQKREIAASLVVFVVKGTKVAMGLVKKVIKEAGVWY